MSKKRIYSAALVMALLLALLAPLAPVYAAGTSGYFTDITDADTAEAAEVLRMLGIVEGVGGTSFNPTGLLSRAEFCKLAMLAADRGGEAAAQAGRVIFPDVPAKHWALGYINAASLSSEEQPALVAGTGSGRFEPDKTVSFGEAVTIVMRVLGYSNGDFSSSGDWWSGYVATAQSIGLTDGLSANGTDTITRAQAARLFANLLRTKPKGGATEYIQTLASSIKENCLILSVSATAADGSKNAVRTTDASYQMANVSSAAAMFEGQQVDLALDASGQILCILPRHTGSSKTFAVSEAKYTGIQTSGGEWLRIDPATTVYTSAESSTYSDIWMNLAVGTVVTAYYSSDGTLLSLYISTEEGETAVIGLTASLATLTEGKSGYSLFKNGVSIGSSDVHTYDVATYHAASNAIVISDNRLTGVYMDGYPNLDTPTRVTILGIEFELLPDAVEMMSKFDIGDEITLLLTPNERVSKDGNVTVQPGKVAAVLPASTISSQAVGAAVFDTTSIDASKSVEITLLGGIVVTGRHEMGYARTIKMNGSLVTVTTDKDGVLKLAEIEGARISGALDVSARTLGGRSVSQFVQVFERVGTSEPVLISYDDLLLASVPEEKILYTSLDSQSQINCIVLDDVTGDRYTYGIIHSAERKNDAEAYIYVENGDGNTQTLLPQITGTNKSYGGIVTSVRTADNLTDRVPAGVCQLMELGTVTRGDFTSGDPAETTVTVTLNGKEYVVSADVVCYNARTEKWFDSLEDIRAYSNSLTLYIDRGLSQGGKIRMIVVS